MTDSKSTEENMKIKPDFVKGGKITQDIIDKLEKEKNLPAEVLLFYSTHMLSFIKNLSEGKKEYLCLVKFLTFYAIKQYLEHFLRESEDILSDELIRRLSIDFENNLLSTLHSFTELEEMIGFFVDKNIVTEQAKKFYEEFISEAEKK